MSVALLFSASGAAIAQTSGRTSTLSAASRGAVSAARRATANRLPTPVVTLDQAVSAALATGPDLEEAELALQNGRESYLQAKAKSSITLSAQGGYLYEDNLPGTTTAITPTTAGNQTAIDNGNTAIGNNLLGGLTLGGPTTKLTLSAGSNIPLSGQKTDTVGSVSLSASQTVFDGYPGLRPAASVRQALDSYMIAQETYSADRLNIEYQVKQEYYILVGDQKTVAASEANLEQANEDLARTKAMYQAAQATSLDVLQAQVADRGAQIDLQSAEHTVVVDRKTLSATLGWPLERVYTVETTPQPVPPTLSLSNADAAANRNRSELIIDGYQKNSAETNLALAKSQYFPTISLVGGAALAQDATQGASQGTYNLGMNVSVPIWQAGLLDSQVKLAEAALKNITIKTNQMQQAIAVDVQRALFNVTDTKNRLTLAQSNLEQAKQTYELYVAKRQVGLATNLDVLTYSAALTSARVALESARTTYILAVLGLEHAMGL